MRSLKGSGLTARFAPLNQTYKHLAGRLQRLCLLNLVLPRFLLLPLLLIFLLVLLLFFLFLLLLLLLLFFLFLFLLLLLRDSPLKLFSIVLTAARA